MFDVFCRSVQKYAMIQPGDQVAVALSGGADSVCLLYLCKRLTEQISFCLSAAHVNHGLRPEAEEEAAFCRRLCREWHIPFYETRVDAAGLAGREKISLELAARTLRYRFLESLEQDKLALAHHKNDQAETVLLHLLRGSGTEGLGAMAPVRGKLIRPLLNFSRQEIEAFCQTEGLAYCTDQSNFSREYTRNRIRLDVMPLLEQVQPGAAGALCRAAELAREDALQLREDTEGAFERMFTPFEDGFFCERKDFFALSPALQRRTVRMCWERLQGGTEDLWFDRLEAALALFREGKTGKKCCLGQEIWAENSYQQLIVGRLREKPVFCLALKEGEPVRPPGMGICFTAIRGKGEPLQENHWIFDYNRVKSGINIRSRRDGDVFCLNGKKQKLKKIFIDRKIPRRERDRAVIAECCGEIIAVTGLGVARDYRGRGEDCLIVKQERVEHE